MVFPAPPVMVKDKTGEGGQIAVGLDPINDGVQPDVLQRHIKKNSHEVRAATWNVSSMVCRSGEVVGTLHRRKIAGRWIDSVVDVVRVTERILYVKLVIGKQI